MTSWSDVSPQREAGSGVQRFGKLVDKLLDMLDVGPLATVEILKVNAGEAAGVFQATKASPVLQGVGIRPSHLEGVCVNEWRRPEVGFLYT